MEAAFFVQNRKKLVEQMEPGSLLALFAGKLIHQSADANYPFYANRNFVYMTGITQPQSVLLVCKKEDGSASEYLYMLPKNPMAERWNGKRLSREEAAAVSGVSCVVDLSAWEHHFHAMAVSGFYERIYLDLHRQSPENQDQQGHIFAKMLPQSYPGLQIRNIAPKIHGLRTIKQPCEIDALRRAEEITKAGILAMMRASRPGMYEYQYKAEFIHALGQFSPDEPGFQPIISAGQNNFCIHYEAYTGKAEDGDMVLNDVGARFDHLITDVSRGWPCNGKFTERQKLLYHCALATSDYMFSIIKPGMKMADVDRIIREYNARQLVNAGVMESVDQVATYMWHGGAHHIGFDVHDVVQIPEVLAPGMVFCVDVGIYHEAWGIGFRLEDNCLVTEDGCENLSAGIPRTIEQIEAYMKENAHGEE